MRTVVITIISSILISVFLSCNIKENNKAQTIHKFEFKPVTPDSAHLFKDTTFRPDDYFEGRYDYGYHISLIRLIATPELYHNKRVSVTGFYHFGLEESTLYLSEEDAKRGNGKNGVFIDFGESPDFSKVVGNFRDKYVTIFGVFDMYSTGHMGSNSGGIKDISRIYLNN